MKVIGNKETVSPFPSFYTSKAVGALTLHTGVRYRYMLLGGYETANVISGDQDAFEDVERCKYKQCF